MQQHCRSLDQERNRRAHSLNGNTAPAASAGAAGDASGAYYLFCFILLSREGKNGFASCTYLDVMRLHDEAAPHRGGQMLLRASVRRCPGAAVCWCEGVPTPQGGAQDPQRHHEARRRATAET